MAQAGAAPLSSAPHPHPSDVPALEAPPMSLWDLEGGQAPPSLLKLGPVHPVQGETSNLHPLGLRPQAC